MSFLLSKSMTQHLVLFIEYCGMSQAVALGFHSVTGHTEIVMRIMMDVMQPIHDVHHVLNHGLHLTASEI
jgi:hypothetical protein